jgi:NAD(P) transhydrogenase subunit alpha
MEGALTKEFMLGVYVFLLAIFLGIELIGKVPATLHTPLMSGTNAIHGIVLLGAMLVLGSADVWWLKAVGFLAVILGAANVFGGFVVTDRMLEMFKRRPGAGTGAKR